MNYIKYVVAATTLRQLGEAVRQLEARGVDLDAKAGLLDDNEGVLRGLAGIEVDNEGFAYVTSRLTSDEEQRESHAAVLRPLKKGLWLAEALLAVNDAAVAEVAAERAAGATLDTGEEEVLQQVLALAKRRRAVVESIRAEVAAYEGAAITVVTPESA